MRLGLEMLRAPQGLAAGGCQGQCLRGHESCTESLTQLHLVTFAEGQGVGGAKGG